MPITDEHYLLVRSFFFNLLGGKCSECGNTNYDEMHFHHLSGNGHILNGENGRGREKRMWDLFIACMNHDLKLLCKSCHLDADSKEVHFDNTGDE